MSQIEEVSVTLHAIERWMQRTGCVSPKKAERRIREHFACAIRLGSDSNHYYSGGWVFVFTNKTIVTVMRPKARAIMDQIKKAVQQQINK